MKLFCILLCLIFLNCKIIRLTEQEKLVFKSNEMKLDLNTALEVKVKIDGSEEVFLFDTGASNTVVFDTTLIKNFSIKEKISLFNTKDPNGKITSFYTPTNIETDFFSFENQLVTILPGMKNYCSNNYFYKGIIGSSFFKKNQNPIYHFDFDNSILENLNEVSNKNDYTEVKTKFYNNNFAIYLNINGYEEPFLFDTGNIAYPLIIGTNSKTKPKIYSEFIGSEGFVASGNIKANTKYSNSNDLIISGYKTNSPICFTSKKRNKYNNVGLEFIKHFNWIVDFENKKVFFKRNNIKIEYIDIIPKYKYLCMINNEKLKIITKLKSELKFNVDDEIISINDKLVTPENICEMQNLLNSTSNWDELNIEIKKP